MKTEEIVKEYATLVGTLRGLVVSMKDGPFPKGYLEQRLRELSAEASVKFNELLGAK